MNGFNLSDIIDAKLGGTSLSAIYFGSNKLWPTTHDYSLDYFTIESLEDNNDIQLYRRSTDAPTITIQWSTDGTNWNNFTSSTSTTPITTLNTGDKIMIKGINTQYASADNGNASQLLKSTKTINVYGNIMSLLYGDNFVGQTTLTANYTFRSLFWQGKIVDASNLILPATTLSQYCYRNLFDANTSLIAAPKVLPAMALTNSCYMNMFIGCSSLTSVPSDMLPATTLAQYCYQGFFANCTKLVNSPVLPATTLVPYCYQSMFQGCSNLKSITCLATDISATRCLYYWLFNAGGGGTFTKKSGVSYSTGISGIPSSWTVINI